MNQLTPAQAAVLSAIKQAQAANLGHPVYRDQARKFLGKVLPPATLSALVKMGKLTETQTSRSGPEQYEAAG